MLLKESKEMLKKVRIFMESDEGQIFQCLRVRHCYLCPNILRLPQGLGWKYSLKHLIKMWSIIPGTQKNELDNKDALQIKNYNVIWWLYWIELIYCTFCKYILNSCQIFSLEVIVQLNQKLHFLFGNYQQNNFVLSSGNFNANMTWLQEANGERLVVTTDK